MEDSSERGRVTMSCPFLRSKGKLFFFLLFSGLSNFLSKLGPFKSAICLFDDFQGESLPHAQLKVARYSFSGSMPPKFEHKLRRHKQSLGKIAPTVVLDKDENLL